MPKKEQKKRTTAQSRPAAADAGAPVPALDTGIALVGVAAGLASFGLTYLRFGIPAYLISLYPVTLLLATYIAVRSVFLALRGQSTWKGRTLLQNQVRWW